jgi:RNA polymerase sigma-70 factor (ECF subfamily)
MIKAMQKSNPSHLAHERTNREWLEDLQGERQVEALTDLRRILLTGLRYTFASYGHVREEDLEDFVQEALLRVLAGLGTFRGESRFTTWARRVAVHAALTELRRKRWQEISLDELTTGEDGSEFTPHFIADPTVDPEQQTVQRTSLEDLRRVIAGELTARQRQALVAVRIQGISTDETARQMGTNRNALYKLLYDAHKRLRERMLAHGTSAQEVIAAFASE